MKTIFPAESVLPGLKLDHKGRVFSIRLQGRDDAMGLDLDAFTDWPKERKRCDGLFLCLPEGSSRFIVVLVELKGGHVEKALTQLRETVSVLCKRREDHHGVHSDANLIRGFRKIAPEGHGKRLLGCIVASKGLSLRQDERSRLQRDFGITVKIRRSAQGLNCTDLASGFPPTAP